jgi:hypothetical protein
MKKENSALYLEVSIRDVSLLVFLSVGAGKIEEGFSKWMR